MPQYQDKEVQATPGAPGNPDPEIDDILEDIKALPGRGSIGEFLSFLFSIPTRKGPSRSKQHAFTVSRFLQGRAKVKPDDIVDLMYEHPDSRPKAIRQSISRAANPDRRNEKVMGRGMIQEWAIKKVEGLVDKEARAVSSKTGGLHVPKDGNDWYFVHNFSLGNLMASVEKTAPTILRLLTAVAIPSKMDSCM